MKMQRYDYKTCLMCPTIPWLLRAAALNESRIKWALFFCWAVGRRSFKFQYVGVGGLWILADQTCLGFGTGTL